MKKVSAFAWLFAYICVGLSMVIDRHAGAEPARDPEADRVRELHKELAGTRGSALVDSTPITFQVVPDQATALVLAKPCSGGTKNDVSFIVNDGNGQPIVSINECSGKVTVSHPERMSDQAREFWRTVQKAFPDVCAVSGK